MQLRRQLAIFVVKENMAKRSANLLNQVANCVVLANTMIKPVELIVKMIAMLDFSYLPVEMLVQIVTRVNIKTKMAKIPAKIVTLDPIFTLIGPSVQIVR